MTSAPPAAPTPALVRVGYLVAAVALLLWALRGMAGVVVPPFGALPLPVLPLTVMGLATVLCAARAVRVRGERLAWGTLAGALALWTTGDALTWFWNPTAGLPEGVAWADVAYFVNYPLGYAGHLLLLRARVRPFRRSISIDGCVIALSLASLTVLLAAPILADGAGGLRMAVTLGYPASDVVLLSFVLLVVALIGRRPGAAWMLILGGLVLSSLGDGVYVAQVAAGDPAAGQAVAWLLPAAGLALSAAAWQPARLRHVDVRARALTRMTVALGGLALAILAFDQVGHVPAMAGLLAIGAVAAALVRGALAFGENAAMMRAAGREARTDPLSGLGNRRALLADLDVACADGREHTLAFFDLDGFKGYNDAFGHGAGDDLLSLLAGDLRAAAQELGRAYRLGGDEFCVLADGALDERDPRMRAIRDALTHAAGDMAIAASLGLVQLPFEAETPSAALQLADERMYADKGERRAAV